MRQRQFGHLGREEATRTGDLAVTEPQVAGTRGDEMHLVRFGGFPSRHSKETVAVEFVGPVVVGFMSVPDGGNAEGGALGDKEAVLENNVGCCNAPHHHYTHGL